MNRSYEIMFIVRPDVDEAEIDKIVETFSGYVTNGGGSVTRAEKMGRRRLAYTIQKFNDGFYILLIVESPASLISEIERRLRVSEPIIKFITVRMDEENKRVAKIQKHRAAHVKRSAMPTEAPAEASAPAAETPAEAPVETGAKTPVEAAAETVAPAEAPAATEAAEPVSA